MNWKAIHRWIFPRSQTFHQWYKAIRHEPVYIFQMGKVGSSSLLRTLEQQWKGHVFHGHRHVAKGHFPFQVLRVRGWLGLSVKVISPVREPISRNVSSFFQNFKRITGRSPESCGWTIEQLIAALLQGESGAFTARWFDDQMKPAFGIDVFSESFPVEAGWKVYRRAKVQLLVYRTDLKRTKQLEIVSNFLSCPILEWTLANVSSRKPYRETYRVFRDQVRLPDSYLEEQLSSKFAMHFWSAQERLQIRERWVVAQDSSTSVSNQS